MGRRLAICNPNVKPLVTVPRVCHTSPGAALAGAALTGYQPPEKRHDTMANKLKQPDTGTSLAHIPGRLTFEEAARDMIAQDMTEQEMVTDILNKDSLEDILGGSTAVGLQSMLGVPFTIHRVDLRESDYADGLPAFAVIHAFLDETNEARVITTGSSVVVAQCISMHRGGHLPQRVVGIQATKATAKGYFPLRLGQAPAYNAADYEQI